MKIKKIIANIVVLTLIVSAICFAITGCSEGDKPDGTSAEVWL